MIDYIVEEKEGCITADEVRTQLQEFEGNEFILTILFGDSSE